MRMGMKRIGGLIMIIKNSKTKAKCFEKEYNNTFDQQAKKNVRIKFIVINVELCNGISWILVEW